MAVPNKLHIEKMMVAVFESHVAAVMSLNAADHSLDTSRAKKRSKISWAQTSSLQWIAVLNHPVGGTLLKQLCEPNPTSVFTFYS